MGALAKRLRHVSSLRVLTVLLLAAAGNAVAQTDTPLARVPGSVAEGGEPSLQLTDAERAWLAAHPRIEITSDLDSPPYLFIGARDEAEGVIVDIATKIGQALGIEFTFTGSTYAELIEAVQSGSADITILNDPLDAPPAQHFIKTRDFLFLPYSLWVRRDSPLLLQSDRSITGKRITLSEGWHLEHPFLRKFVDCTWLQDATVRDSVNAVLSGEADAYLEVYGIVSDYCQRNMVVDLTPLEVYYEGCPAAFCVRKDWPELRSALDKALNAISEQALLEILTRWRSYLEDPSFRLKVLDLTSEERDWLHSHPVVRVVSDPQWAPIEFLGASGEPQGIAQDYLRRFQELLGIRFEVVPSTSWRDALDILYTGRADMASAILETPERDEHFLFSEPYLSMNVAIFSQGDVAYLGGLDNLAGRRVAVVDGEAVHELMAADFPEIELVPMLNVTAALQALAREEVFAFVGNIAVTSYYIAKTGQSQIKVVGETPYTYDLRIATRQNLPELHSILNKALQAISSAERQAIYQKWISVTYEHRFNYTLLWQVLAGAGLLIALFFGQNLRLSALVRKRTGALTRSNEQLTLEIEERKRAAAALESSQATLQISEARYRSLFTATQNAIVVLRDDIIFDCNPAAERIFACTREAILGQKLIHFAPPRQPDGQESGHLLLQYLADAQKTGQSHFEWQCCRMDGTLFDAELNLSPLQLDSQPHLQVIIRDITERKARDYERARLVTALEQSPEIIVMTDTNATILYVNPAFERITGYTKSEVLGRNPSILKSGVHPAAFYESLWDTLSRGEKWVGRFVNKAKDGHTFIESAIISPVFDSTGSIMNYVAVKRDITHEEEMENQLRQAQKMEAIGQLAGGIAHDLNNLLHVINGYALLACKETDPQSPLGLRMQEVADAGERASKLVSQLLTFSRRQILKPEFLNLNRVIEEFLKFLSRVLGEHVIMDYVPGERMGVIRADRSQIEQILMNLCVNARDAMPNGGTLTLRTEDAMIDAEFCAGRPWAKPGRYALLHVTDTGHGMDEETQKHIFEPFFTTKDVGKGTGLGLATVYGVVRQHDGMISVKSAPGCGAEFLIYLPASESRLIENLLRTPGAPHGGDETILIAEDEDNVRNLTQLILTGAGYKIISASDGEEALTRYAANASSIQLILLDVVMPKRNGKDVFDQIRRMNAHIPFLFTSGYSAGTLKEDFLLTDGVEIIQKPFSPQTLLSKVREILDAHARPDDTLQQQ